MSKIVAQNSCPIANTKNIEDFGILMKDYYCNYSYSMFEAIGNSKMIPSEIAIYFFTLQNEPNNRQFRTTR